MYFNFFRKYKKNDEKKIKTLDNFYTKDEIIEFSSKPDDGITFDYQMNATDFLIKNRYNKIHFSLKINACEVLTCTIKNMTGCEETYSHCNLSSSIKGYKDYIHINFYLVNTEEKSRNYGVAAYVLRKIILTIISENKDKNFLFDVFDESTVEKHRGYIYKSIFNQNCTCNSIHQYCYFSNNRNDVIDNLEEEVEVRRKSMVRKLKKIR